MLTTRPSSTVFDPREALRLVSRTFALSIERLPGLLGDATMFAYLVFRVSDFLEDNESMPPERKVELLNLWVQILDGEVDVHELTAKLQDTDPNDPEAEVARQADAVLSAIGGLPEGIREIILEEARGSAMGMARWQARGPVVHDEEDLDDYMFEVAGRVGHMLTHLFAWYHEPLRKMSEELMPLACEFGLALQTVNVIRGMRKDFERGWIFVPESFCREVGINPPDLFRPENLEPAMEVVNRLATKAEGHLRNGLIYIKRIPRRYHWLRVACLWPLFFAVRTLAISRSNRMVLESEAKITRDEVKRIVMETQAMGWSNQWLDLYYDRLSRFEA
ncbi:MAG: squalene/phytoene synthase family protein [Anaerolineae bacterium]|nr:squalene/phytoene synthase family protein [Anaerolineae bacterium]